MKFSILKNWSIFLCSFHVQHKTLFLRLSLFTMRIICILSAWLHIMCTFRFKERPDHTIKVDSLQCVIFYHIFYYALSFTGLCTTTDVDALLYHMNNARYLRELDFARADFFERTDLYREVCSQGSGLVQGAATIRYRRFIKPLTIFKITSKVIQKNLFTYRARNSCLDKKANKRLGEIFFVII